MDGGFVARPEMIKTTLLANELRRHPDSNGNLSWEELLVLVARGDTIYVGGNKLTEQEALQRLIESTRQRIARLQRSPTGSGEFTQRKINRLGQFQQQLKVSFA